MLVFGCVAFLSKLIVDIGNSACTKVISVKSAEFQAFRVFRVQGFLGFRVYSVHPIRSLRDLPLGLPHLHLMSHLADFRNSPYHCPAQPTL